MEKLEKLRNEYVAKTADVLDYEKFNHYAVVHHSSGIEGSSLTQQETNLLLDEKITPGGKPVEHTFMELDHYEALKYTLSLAEKREPLKVEHIQEISAQVLKNTRGEVNTALGNFDPSKGDFRLVPVCVGNTSFAKAEELPLLVEQLVADVNRQMEKVKGFKAVNALAFQAHYQLVSIHPFADGNGRTSRLLMNYVQAYHEEPLTIVFKQDKLAYFKALQDTLSTKNIKVFFEFMFDQAAKYFSAGLSNLSRIVTLSKTDRDFHFLF